jgi:hypothetical protein
MLRARDTACAELLGLTTAAAAAAAAASTIQIDRRICDSTGGAE